MTLRTRGWLLAIAVACVYTAAQTAQLAQVLPGVPWLVLYLVELPVWLSLIAISPAVFWLARRFPLFGPHTLRNLLAHLLPGACVVCLQFLLVESIRRFVLVPLLIHSGMAATKPALDYVLATQPYPLLSVVAHVTRTYAVFWVLIYFALVAFYYSFNYHRELNATRLHSQELQTLLAQSQLDSLRLQLQPHFLFNTLNTVSSLMTRDVILARRTLARLSDLLRTTLRDSSVHEMTLASELAFLDAYLEIQSARFGDRLVIEKKIDPDVENLLVPRMLLQPLVENSIRHGMRDGGRPLCVRVEAARVDTSLCLRVFDDGRGVASGRLKERVGLRNTRQRLEQLYGSGQQMEIVAPANGGFEITLTIPARVAEQTDAVEQRQREIA